MLALSEAVVFEIGCLAHLGIAAPLSVQSASVAFDLADAAPHLRQARRPRPRRRRRPRARSGCSRHRIAAARRGKARW